MSRLSSSEVVSYSGSVTAITSSLTLTDIGVIIGIVTAVLTFGVNLYFTNRRDRREKEIYKATLEKLKTGGEP